MPSRMCVARHSDTIDILTTFEEGMVLIKDVLHGIILTAHISKLTLSLYRLYSLLQKITTRYLVIQSCTENAKKI